MNKYKADDSLDKHKSRLVAKCFAQKEWVDYEETFVPTTKWATIWILFALAAQNGWKVHQKDVKTAFLNGDMKENVFMSQPKGFVVKGQEHKVFVQACQILVGLKQAPQACWQNNFISCDVCQLSSDGTGNNENYIASIKKELRKGFEMTDLGYVHYSLSIEITQHLKFIFLSQKKYIRVLLKWFGMAECNLLTIPMEYNLKLTSIERKDFEDVIRYIQLVGSLDYLTTTKPNISFVVGILFRFMQKLCEGHWSVAKRFLK
eukprot:PITA_34893